LAGCWKVSNGGALRSPVGISKLVEGVLGEGAVDDAVFIQVAGLIFTAHPDLADLGAEVFGGVGQSGKLGGNKLRFGF
jgi:hypothetical protein